MPSSVGVSNRLIGDAAGNDAITITADQTPVTVHGHANTFAMTQATHDHGRGGTGSVGGGGWGLIRESGGVAETATTTDGTTGEPALLPVSGAVRELGLSGAAPTITVAGGILAPANSDATLGTSVRQPEVIMAKSMAIYVGAA
jgi:hypothetical protein